MKLFRKNNIYYTNGLVFYGKNSEKDYKIEFKPLFLRGNITLYRGKRKPVVKNLYVISVFIFPIALIAPTAMLLGLPFFIYFTGAINFFKDSLFQDNVKAFHYTNLVIFIILIIYLIFS